MKKRMMERFPVPLHADGRGNLRQVKMQDMFMNGVIYFAAGFTISLLFLILGYVIYNGLFYKIRAEYEELPYASDTAGTLAVIVNPDLDIKYMQYSVLEGLFTDSYANWKKIGAGVADVYPYITGGATDIARKYFGGMGRLTETTDAEHIAGLVASKAGGVGLLTAAEYGQLEKKSAASVKRLPIRGIRIVCSEDTAALHGNLKMGAVDDEMLSRIAAGEAASWKELGGGDIPVTVVVPPDDAPFLYDYADEEGVRMMRRFFTAAGDSASAKGFPRIVMAADEESFFAALCNGSGAVSFAPAWLAPSSISSLKYAGMERGVNLRPSFLLEKPVDGGRSGGISSIIINTFIMILLTLLLAVPFGLFAAVYLVLYAKEGRMLRLLRLGTETLAGIPSIIFGLFGMLVFVQGLGWGISLISGCFTLALMILPTIVRTAEEAIRAVPLSIGEGSTALGGTKVQTVFRVILPAAFPAVSAGVILASGRALGETAALIYTMGSNYNITSGLFDSTRTLAVHLYLVIAEGIASEKAFASATVLIVLIFIINTLAKLAIGRLGAQKP